MNITHFGWDDRLATIFQEHKAAGRVPAGISLQVKSFYLALTEIGEMPAELTGRLRYDAVTPLDFPVVGDWVAATILEESETRAQIHAVLKRRSLFCRKEVENAQLLNRWRPIWILRLSRLLWTMITVRTELSAT